MFPIGSFPTFSPALPSDLERCRNSQLPPRKFRPRFTMLFINGSVLQQIHGSLTVQLITMAEESLISSLYPPPPAYYKYFTSENVNRAKELEASNGEIPEDAKYLEFLTPPRQPEGETYRSFGNVWQFNDKIPQLEDMGIPQLYKPSDVPDGDDSQAKILALKKLIKSLLLNFLEVVGVMSVDPKEFSLKVEHIRTILINIHHLLNEYRPHQSRESLILLMENQVETKKNEILEIKRVCSEVEDKIKSLVEIYVDGKAEVKHEDDELQPPQEVRSEMDVDPVV